MRKLFDNLRNDDFYSQRRKTARHAAGAARLVDDVAGLGAGYDAPGDAVKEMERQMSINDDVVRFMTIRVDEHEEDQSVMMRSGRGRDRDDRGPRDRDSRPPRRDDIDAKPAKAEADKADAKEKEDKASEEENS